MLRHTETQCSKEIITLAPGVWGAVGFAASTFLSLKVLYTHNHRDHISGASVFSNDENITIFAQVDFSSDRVAIEKNPCALIKRWEKGLRHSWRWLMIGKDQNIDLDGVPGRLILALGHTKPVLGNDNIQLRLSSTQ